MADHSMQFKPFQFSIKGILLAMLLVAMFLVGRMSVDVNTRGEMAEPNSAAFPSAGLLTNHKGTMIKFGVANGIVLGAPIDLAKSESVVRGGTVSHYRNIARVDYVCGETEYFRFSKIVNPDEASHSMRVLNSGFAIPCSVEHGMKADELEMKKRLGSQK